MDNESLLLSLGVVRPCAHTAAGMFNDVFPDAAPRPNEFIRGQSPRIVKLEIEILLLAYNLMRYVMAMSGKGSAGIRFGIASTSAAVKSFPSVIQSVYRAGRSCTRAFSRLVAAVVSDVLPRRKRRPYVRAVKRRPKPYPLMTKPRGEYASEEVK